MSRAAQMDKTIRGLLPLESYRSPWVPTNRLGQEALVAIAAPFRQTSGTSVVPSHWFAVRPDFSMLLAFARTNVVTPVVGFQVSACELPETTMTSREAHAVLWRLSSSVWEDYFARRDAAPGVAEEVEAAISATVPGHLQSWLRLCCADYFDWLSRAPATDLPAHPI